MLVFIFCFLMISLNEFASLNWYDFNLVNGNGSDRRTADRAEITLLRACDVAVRFFY